MKKNLIKTVLPLTALVFILLFLSIKGDEDSNAVKRTRMLMGTIVEITVFHEGNRDKSDEHINEAFKEIKRLEELLGRQYEGSDIWKINNRPGENVSVSEETLDLVEAGLHFHAISQGSFDITLGKLIDLWRFKDEEEGQSPPPDDDIKAAIKISGPQNLNIDRPGKTISTIADVHLDLGGIAKGFIIDRAGELLAQRNVKNFIIDAGGDMIVKGKKGDKAWRVGLRHPRKPGEVLASLDLNGDLTSIVTSGDYEQVFFHEGKRYHHILDPSTGYPAKGLMSVTIKAGDAKSADALSTAVFVLGKEKGLRLIESLNGVEGVLVDEDSKVTISSGLKGQVLLR
ncbi:MAG: FAD:protein FMN transferase [Proteobacteria bacterium]|nr:FAD:protein FMN transferase [Pseudomonadota bacterium]